MKSARIDLTIEQGSTFSYSLTWKDANGQVRNLSSGWTARLQVRESVTSSSTAISLTSSAGITLSGNTPNIVLGISATDPSALTIKQGVYDLELVNGSNVYRLLHGNVSVSPEVTR